MNRKAPDNKDLTLDALLAKHFRGEPRSGLENRILANLRSQSAQEHRWYWVAPLAAALVITVVVVAATLRPSLRTGSKPAQSSTAERRLLNEGTPVVARSIPTPSQRVAPEARPYHRRRGAMRDVRQQQFPIPEALSRQEWLLTLYAQQVQPQKAPVEALQLEKPITELKVDELKIPLLETER